MSPDLYNHWLGILPEQQPPNHYCLLGIESFESDPTAITLAANRQMALLQRRASNQRVALPQPLLNEIAAARQCLLAAERKAQYDADLRQRLTEIPSEESEPTAGGETEGAEAIVDRPPPTGLAATTSLIGPQRTRPSYLLIAAGVLIVLLLPIGAFVLLRGAGPGADRPASSNGPATSSVSPSTDDPTKTSPALPAIRLSVSDSAAWRVHDPDKPIAELIEYNKADDCAKFLQGAVIAHYELCKYDRYVVTFQYRRTQAGWCNIVLQPNCALMIGSPHGTGILAASGHSLVPLTGQKVVKDGEGMWIPPMREAEKLLGQWNDVRIEVDLKRWVVTMNGRTIHKADFSVFRLSPFWLQGGVGFEFRSVEVVPLAGRSEAGLSSASTI